MKPVILFRKCTEAEQEIKSAAKYFSSYANRSAVPENSLVIGRYSVLPYYEELVCDLTTKQSRLINSYSQHRYLADVGNWYRDIYAYTPKTWTHLDAVPNYAYPIIIKGRTNSKKFLWDTHMYAANKQEAAAVISRLFVDPTIGDQQLYFRKYVRLKQFMSGLRGLPVTKEFRVFVLDGQVLTRAFYWSNYVDDIISEGHPASSIDPNEVPADFLRNVISCIGNNARFYTIDVAQMIGGGWIVIELNDGQMSGLSMTDPDELYKSMYEVLRYTDPAVSICPTCKKPSLINLACYNVECNGNVLSK